MSKRSGSANTAGSRLAGPSMKYSTSSGGITVSPIAYGSTVIRDTIVTEPS